MILKNNFVLNPKFWIDAYLKEISILVTTNSLLLSYPGIATPKPEIHYQHKIAKLACLLGF